MEKIIYMCVEYVCQKTVVRNGKTICNTMSDKELILKYTF